jgi:hypothetical protein
MADDIVVKWSPGAQNKLLNVYPDTIVYQVARMTLDMSYTTIPLSNRKNAGQLRRTSMAAGVRGSNENYYIGSYTDYAKYVWKMPNESTNWSTPGTNSQWYLRYWNKSGKSVINTVLERNKLK